MTDTPLDRPHPSPPSAGAGQIGTLPMWELAPLDYRCALDAALSLLAGEAAPRVHCYIPALASEAHQRLPNSSKADSTQTALWIEPMAGDWQIQLDRLLECLESEGLLLILASRPPAHLLPERQGWPGQPLGLQPRGLGRLRRALRRHGLGLEREVGFHTLASVGFGLSARIASRFGHPDLGDRLAVAARLRYATTGHLAAISTVALLVARRRGA